MEKSGKKWKKRKREKVKREKEKKRKEKRKKEKKKKKKKKKKKSAHGFATSAVVSANCVFNIVESEVFLFRWFGSPTGGSHVVLCSYFTRQGEVFTKEFDIFLDFGHTSALVAMIGGTLAEKCESTSISGRYTTLQLVLVVVLTILLTVAGKSCLPPEAL